MKAAYRDYLGKNSYFLNSFISFSDKIPLYFLAEESLVLPKMAEMFDEKLFAFVTNKIDSCSIRMEKDASIFADGYSLNIRKDKQIIIKAAHLRGVKYAIRLLNDLVDHKFDKYNLPIMLIDDEPSFMHRGIIEGYYGEPWSHTERTDMFDFMDHVRLNTYMYAPKFDVYHRKNWYELYPETEFAQMAELKSFADKQMIDFCYCIAPGHAETGSDAFNYSSDHDFETLYRKLDQMFGLGIKQFGLLLDDIDYQLSPTNKAIFKRPGIAHAHICNKVFAYLQEKDAASKLVMCPTEYHQIGATEYRTDLKNDLHPDISVFWTGDNVCSEAITSEDALLTKAAYQKEMYIWDNFPVSDFTYGVREFIAPLQNRTVDLSKYASGYMINPSSNYFISKIAMTTMAHYAWNSHKYDHERSFEIAIKSIGEDFYAASRSYIEFNYPSILSYGNIVWEKEMISKKAYPEILSYYERTIASVREMLKLDYPIIEELKPWLYRAIAEREIVIKIIEQKIRKPELLEFLKNIKFSGSEVLDYLLLDHKILTDLEYEELITKRRGPKWYRIFEEKKWLK